MCAMPDHDIAAYLREGHACIADGDLLTAQLAFRKALSLQADNGEAMANLGWLAEQQQDWHAAANYYEQALALLAPHAQLRFQLAHVLLQLKRFEEAELHLLQGLQLEPTSATGWSHYGMLRTVQYREVEAEEAYRHAIALAPDKLAPRFNLSYLLLRQGRLQEGWQYWEARPWQQLSRYAHTKRLTTGQSLKGMRVLITQEGGAGDLIQFCRYLPLLRREGVARLGLVCDRTLLGLMQGLTELADTGHSASPAAPDVLLDFSATINEADWDGWLPLMSLPVHVQTRFDSIPAGTSYLSLPAALTQHWQQLFPQTRPRPLRIGLAWQGNPAFENDADRSIRDIRCLLPLAELSGIDWISLQKMQHGAQDGVAAWNLASPERPLQNYSSALHDFADTAALIQQLDLVISVDTAVAHLAGALGKPCWLMLPWFKPDWRWLNRRQSSPWYPQTRLFRQTAAGDWDSVVTAIRAALISMR
ncbi:tetratricopeptide repeat protein [Undibacterium rugosum]|uniref:tetratricopeptide repeat protein n=1 Tax=Undibacterium rugosum TaxID=2762291 RepID=UPI001B8455DC|nr:tetratricopeptide repeat protein [Undibacterium rugosum]MBR7777467.1 tetratricopeptide repeat protein [Undibacterium rugosum]